MAENLAIDDMMYYLERALASQQNKTVDLPIFLRYAIACIAAISVESGKLMLVAVA